MNKEEMVRKLVAYSVKTALSESKHYWLSDLFEKGFAGYRNLSRGQLVAELEMRGIDDDKRQDDDYASDLDDDLDDLDDLDLDSFAESSFDLPARAAD